MTTANYLIRGRGPFKTANHFNENVSVNVTIPSRQQQPGCEYFEVQ